MTLKKILLLTRKKISLTCTLYVYMEKDITYTEEDISLANRVLIKVSPTPEIIIFRKI